MKNSLFIFDIDGTLTDSVFMYLEAVTKSLQSVGITNIDTDYDNYKHHTDSYALRYNYEQNFNTEVPSDLLHQFETDLVCQMSKFDPVKEIKGAKSLLEMFRVRNIAFCFATGSLPEPSMIKLDQCDIWYDEKILATSKTHESREGFVLDAIERAKAFYDQNTFDQIISIGDGVWDLKTARNLSLDFVGIGERNRTKLLELGATTCFKDLNEFGKTLF